MCPNYEKGCVWAVAQLFDEATIDIVRKKQRFTISGADYSVRGTCPYCFDYATMVVKENKLQQDGLTILEKDKYYEEVAKAKAEREARNQPVRHDEPDEHPNPDNNHSEQPDTNSRSYTAK